MFAGDRADFTVIIDEVENHLHPTMQRRILPDLLNAFPTVKFIVSTHAPLIINSFYDANVCALRYRENKVYSQKLDFLKQAKTAAEILNEVLGVSTTMPVWAEEKIQDLIERISKMDLNETTFSQMRSELKLLGLGEYMPEALGGLLDKHDQN